jgi:solute carrier family 25 phosphate transporter 3
LSGTASGRPLRGAPEEREPAEKAREARRRGLDSPTAAAAAGAAFLALLLVAALAPLVSAALDHPAVDGPVLGIPSPVPDARFFVAGGVSAAASHGLATPIDVVKTRMQADDGLRRAGPARAAAELWRREGPAALLAGLGPTVAGYGAEGALKFGLYESLKPVAAEWLHSVTTAASDDPALPYLLASVGAGAAASVVLCPMEQLRIRSVTDPAGSGGLPELASEGGARGLFRGLPAMLSKQVPYTYGKQATYDEIAAALYSASCGAGPGGKAPGAALEVSVAAAFLASLAACLLSHPGDVVLTATYEKKGAAAGREDEGGGGGGGIAAVVRRLYAERGAGAFFSGLSARLVHVAAIVTSQLVLYDIVKQMLGLPATGAH